MKKKRLDEIIRVDHAGEHGAIAIYRGQLSVLKLIGDKKTSEIILEMAQGEKAHADEFDRLIDERGTRPTALMPLWNIAGYTLGIMSAIAGKDSVMACTEAVEDVIDGHYSDQIKELENSGKESNILETIRKFHVEEIEHERIAKNEISENTPTLRAFKRLVKIGCKTAINLSEKI
jgi:ubiquinone biosynthesis monooxygenase Coq7|tara:strand:- start:18 stop:545 length:528 start_codon:yes stop_codon:yes gene_type:complete